MRKFLLTLSLFTGITTAALAADNGYNIKLHITDKANAKVYLAHYYGKPLPTIYKMDSVTLDANGKGVLSTEDKVIGGIYIMVMADNSSYFEFLLKNGDDFSVKSTASKLPEGVEYKNSPENERFLSYVNYLRGVGEQQQKIQKGMSAAKTKADSTAVLEKSKKLNRELIAYRKDYIKKHPNTLLSNIFGALLMPEVPEGKHTLPDGIEDKNYSFYYFKTHYWDSFDFSDNRLVYTPIYDNKLEYFFKNMVMQVPDSINHEADKLLAEARAGDEVFKYTLHWLAKYTQNSKIMGIDASFVHLVENYYMKGDATWLNPGTLQKYVDRAKSIAPNVIGNIAPEIKMQDMDGNIHSLNDFEAKYTLLVFWSPDCGHCQEEVPKIDSVYNAELKKKGVRIFAVNVDREEVDKWKKVIKESGGLNDWLHVYDPERKSNFKSQYDVYGTPRIYLLDERKIIIGKMLDYKTIGTVIQIEEDKAKTSKK